MKKNLKVLHLPHQRTPWNLGLLSPEDIFDSTRTLEWHPRFNSQFGTGLQTNARHIRTNSGLLNSEFNSESAHPLPPKTALGTELRDKGVRIRYGHSRTCSALPSDQAGAGMPTCVHCTDVWVQSHVFIVLTCGYNRMRLLVRTGGYTDMCLLYGLVGRLSCASSRTCGYTRVDCTD